jgi:hypothetical protein
MTRVAPHPTGQEQPAAVRGGVLAGTISMALGAYVAAKSQPDVMLETMEEKELGTPTGPPARPTNDAVTMGTSFVIGPAVPIRPYLFLDPAAVLVVSAPRRTSPASAGCRAAWRSPGLRARRRCSRTWSAPSSRTPWASTRPPADPDPPLPTGNISA